MLTEFATSIKQAELDWVAIAPSVEVMALPRRVGDQLVAVSAKTAQARAAALTGTRSLRDCPNGEAINGLHDRLLVELYTTDAAKLRELRLENQGFGRPPVTRSAEIEPIRSAMELVAEGELMQHCCATHAWSAHTRDVLPSSPPDHSARRTRSQSSRGTSALRAQARQKKRGAGRGNV